MPTYSDARVSERLIDETIGLCRGIIADGAIYTAEAKALLSWLDRNMGVANTWPFNRVYLRIHAMLRDGLLDDAEERELLQMLDDITGGVVDDPDSLALSCSSRMAISQPEPAIDFPGRSFVLTGTFIWGTRKRCEKAILTLGGRVVSSVSPRTNYLVIGTVGSEQWVHSTHGRKIETAVRLKDEGHDIAVVSEENWARTLDAHGLC